MIAVTGANGHLGRLVIQDLLSRGVRPAEVVAIARNPDRAGDMKTRGVQVRRADYGQPDALADALDGVEKLLLISGTEVGQRVAQHRNVVDAASTAGVRLLAYTSIAKADRTPMLLAQEHRATEEYIRASGVPFVLLRNSWYFEVYTAQLPMMLQHGVIQGCADDGRVSAAARADYAAAAAAVLSTDGHEHRIYELGGDDAFTMLDLAAEISRQSGKNVVYRDLPFDEYVRVLMGFGMPEPVARTYADADLGIARGDLFVDRHDLSRLIGRRTTPLSTAVAAALREQGGPQQSARADESGRSRGDRAEGTGPDENESARQ